MFLRDIAILAFGHAWIRSRKKTFSKSCGYLAKPLGRPRIVADIHSFSRVMRILVTGAEGYIGLVLPFIAGEGTRRRRLGYGFLSINKL
jgi:hypothetical protein